MDESTCDAYTFLGGSDTETQLEELKKQHQISQRTIMANGNILFRCSVAVRLGTTYCHDFCFLCLLITSVYTSTVLRHGSCYILRSSFCSSYSSVTARVESMLCFARFPSERAARTVQFCGKQLRAQLLGTCMGKANTSTIT